MRARSTNFCLVLPVSVMSVVVGSVGAIASNCDRMVPTGVGENNHVAAYDRALQVGFGAVDGFALQCRFQHRLLVAAHDRPGETTLRAVPAPASRRSGQCRQS